MKYKAKSGKIGWNPYTTLIDNQKQARDYGSNHDLIDQTQMMQH